MDIKETEAYDKIVKVIASCKTRDQIQVAAKMARLFNRQVSSDNSGMVDIIIGKLHKKMLDLRYDEI